MLGTRGTAVLLATRALVSSWSRGMLGEASHVSYTLYRRVLFALMIFHYTV